VRPLRAKREDARVAKELTNGTIADRLLSFAALLDLADANPFAARAYRRAADLVRATPAPVATLVREGRVRELRGIGSGIEMRLRELVETGEIAELRDLESRLSPELIGLGRLLGLTSRRVLDIAAALEISTAAELRTAVDEGRLRAVPGIGAKIEAQIRTALTEPPRPRRGLTINRSLQLLESIAVALDGVVAGDARRGCELSYELAVVCSAPTPEPVHDAFEKLPQIVGVVEREERRAGGVTVEGVPVVLVVAEPERFGTELVRATGSPAYVESLGSLPDGSTEEEVFAALGLTWTPPELRETYDAEVPSSLVEVADLRGDLHCHTAWSDGRATVAEMGRAALERGYDYLAICDHTRSVRVVPGLDADDLRRQGEEVAAVNEELAPFVVLRGIECDILPDGGLDLPEAALAELDWVQISLHAGQRRSRGELTKVVTEAMRSPYARALSHPKGRILNHRPENDVDLDAVFQVALETGVAVEINGLPDRLDLSSTHAREALAAGVDLVLSSDGHSAAGLASIEFAVTTARRAGAPRERVVNTRPLAAVRGLRP
jgi:DNA polymerase (family X)